MKVSFLRAPFSKPNAAPPHVAPRRKNAALAVRATGRR
jgi:hypothetical protein